MATFAVVFLCAVIALERQPRQKTGHLLLVTFLSLFRVIVFAKIDQDQETQYRAPERARRHMGTDALVQLASQEQVRL
jgi:hypothetical protein